MKRLIKQLSEISGPPGNEHKVRAFIKHEIEGLVDQIEIDRIGNLIATKKGMSKSGPSLMITAHMDEIALMVEYIEENGTIRFMPVGFIDQRIYPSQHVNIHTKTRVIRGVIGILPPHLIPEEAKDKIIPHEKLYIDVGLKNRKEVKTSGIRIGDYITFSRPFLELGKDLVASKALDNRVGCAVMIESLRMLSKVNHEATVYFVGTTQEEVGFRGAKVAAFKVNPDMAIVLDACPTNPEDPKARVKLGNGPIIRYIEKHEWLGMIGNRKMIELMVKSAKQEGIPYQMLVRIGTTDAAAIHLVREGIPTVTIEIPVRYEHSPVEVASISDVTGTTRLVAAFVEKLTSIFAASL